MQNIHESTDQAAGLRNLSPANPVQVIAISSGKGGVGKTNVSVNLAVSLAKLNKNVMLMDADLGMANVDLLLGLQPQHNMFHVLTGEKTLEEVIITGPSGIKIIPAASGIKKMADLGEAESIGIVRAFSELTENFDFMLVDTAAGISESVIRFCHASQEILVVICDEPSSITDAYALIKVLSRDYGVQRFNIVTNMTATVAEGRLLFNKLSRVTDKFLDVTLNLLPSIPFDHSLRKAVQKMKPVVELFPSSTSAHAFTNLAREMSQWTIPKTAGSRIEFFAERMFTAN